MRALWVLIAVLVSGAVALLAMPRGEGDSVPAVAGTRITVPRGAAPEPGSAAEPAVKSASSTVATPVPSNTALDSAQKAPATAVAPAPTVAAPRGGISELGMDRTIPTATIARGELVRRPDGSILADGKWPIGGDGSPERPYEITWDLLLSAKETYQPRLGEFVIPQRVALLDGAHVRISGYVAFPIVASEADECLLMLNQWDGCCIGVPPSPYDGIEARLVRSQDNSRKHLFLYGTLTGVFHVDPFVQGKWLVGLYTMTDADLVTDL